MRFPVTYVQCKPVLHTDMVTRGGGGRPLFPLGVQHLHEEGLGGRAAATVLVVEVLLAAHRQAVDLGQELLHLVEFILKPIVTFSKDATLNSIRQGRYCL